ncbi:MAG: 50S ribosomal protein L19e [Fervidicoccaceae archaeon]
MTDYTLQKRLAAEILGVGISRIKVKIESDDDREALEGAITRDDVRRLLERGLIRVEPEKSNSRGRARENRERRREGRSRGPGKRKGKATARSDEKRAWIMRARKMRKYLKYLRDKGHIDRKTYRKYYMLVKGGKFSSLAALRLSLEKEVSRK